jgi:hypothetical protein
MQKSLTNAMWFAYRGDASVAVIAFLPGDPNASRSISLIRPGLLDRAAVARMHVFVRASRVRVRVRGLEQDAKIASRSDFGATGACCVAMQQVNAWAARWFSPRAGDLDALRGTLELERAGDRPASRGWQGW